MPEIHLPQKIIFERNAIEHFSFKRVERTILICDSEIIKNRGTLERLENKFRKFSAQVRTVFYYQYKRRIRFADSGARGSRC